jgi:hypothetical protein
MGIKVSFHHKCIRKFTTWGGPLADCSYFSDPASLTRKSETKHRALAGLGFNPEAAVVAFENPAADSQTDAGAGILLAPVETLEDPEDAVVVAGFDADAVVAHAEEPFGGCLLDRDADARGVPYYGT